ncbi:MAG: hypothetical protein LC808_00490 [Actinobacteria bacterium]|nr:hypothetical protein [Actinomycetota bacterium]
MPWLALSSFYEITDWADARDGYPTGTTQQRISEWLVAVCTAPTAPPARLLPNQREPVPALYRATIPGTAIDVLYGLSTTEEIEILVFGEHEDVDQWERNQFEG